MRRKPTASRRAAAGSAGAAAESSWKAARLCSLTWRKPIRSDASASTASLPSCRHDRLASAREITTTSSLLLDRSIGVLVVRAGGRACV